MKKASSLLLLFLLAASAFAHAQKRPAITGVAFVRVYAADASSSANFYGNTLGLHGTQSDGLTRYAVSDSQWLEVKPLPSPAPTSRLEAIAFTTRNVAALQSYLKANSIEIVQPLQHGIFGVHDPEGNLILFIQRGVRPTGVPSPSPTAVSHRIIHAGMMVRDRAAEDKFYRDILGFRPYWYGGMKEGRADWVSLQVPDGSDWIEYMLNQGPNPSAKALGVVNHFSLGVAHMPDAVAALARNHCQGPDCTASKLGRDGKVQLNLYDPDLTRAELMEFAPSGTICCSPFTGKPLTAIENR